MSVQVNPKDVAIAVGIFAALYVGYRAVKGVSDAAGAVGDLIGSAGDAIGHAWEWTTDAFKPNPYRESITSVEEIVYDEMGNVIGTRTVDAPSSQPQTVFTNEQVDRISGGWNWGFGDLSGGGGLSGPSFNDVLKGGY